MNHFSVVDESFDISLSSSYYLSIRMAPNGFSFCVLDPIYNRFIQFKECRLPKPDMTWRQTIDRLKNETVLFHDYKRKLIVLEDDVFSLVPTALFKPEMSSDLMGGTFDVNMAEKQVTENRIKMVDAVNLFLMPDKISSFIREHFADAKVLHHMTPFIESTILDDYSSADQTYVHVYFRQAAFDVLVMEQRNLKLANSFKYADDNEIVYFLLYVFEQLKLQTGKTQILISGDIELQSARYLMLKSYLKSVKMASLPVHFQFGDALQTVDFTRYLLMFNSFLCV